MNSEKMDSTLIQLVKHFETYQLTSKDDFQGESLSGFVLYLNQQLAGELTTEAQRLTPDSWKSFDRDNLEEMAAAYLGKMGRFTDNYCRKTMPNTALATIDEFTYLIALMQFPSMTKSELIAHNVHQITTGTEIIKRLISKGFIAQMDDLHDKRSVRVSITEAGKIALFSSTNEIKQIAHIATGVLSNEELIQLVATLKKLELFHNEVYKSNKLLGLKELIEIHLKK